MMKKEEVKMEIEILKEIHFDELESKVRSVPLMKRDDSGKEIFVYENSHISFRDISPHEVNPTTFYVLKDSLQFQRDLRETLLKRGIDTLHLDRAYEIKNESGEIWTLMPPVVEVAIRSVKFVPRHGEIPYSEPFRLRVPIINDGAHRAYLARELGESFTCIYISDVDPKFPFYAHPNEWADVRMVDSVPADKKDKKMYSMEDCYALYRNFGILGCGAPRKTGGGT